MGILFAHVHTQKLSFCQSVSPKNLNQSQLCSPWQQTITWYNCQKQVSGDKTGAWPTYESIATVSHIGFNCWHIIHYSISWKQCDNRGFRQHNTVNGAREKHPIFSLIAPAGSHKSAHSLLLSLEIFTTTSILPPLLHLNNFVSPIFLYRKHFLFSIWTQGHPGSNLMHSWVKGKLNQCSLLSKKSVFAVSYADSVILERGLNCLTCIIKNILVQLVHVH